MERRYNKKPSGATPKKSARTQAPRGAKTAAKKGAKPALKKGTTKKAYGNAESFTERKKLKSFSKPAFAKKGNSEKGETDKKWEGKTAKSSSRPVAGKGKFTKKNELKGFKPKASRVANQDFRFMKPGSKGKEIIISEDSFEKVKAKGNSKEWVTESALSAGSEVRLNRFISNAGVCSRREADELIGAGLVTINDKVVTELGTKVKAGDVVKFNGERLSVEAKVYILLNKPKDAITTAEDPEGRNTVMDLFEGKMKERIFPVGRLDRNTTGVLLLTNDGELANRLMHPKHQIAKVYKATLNKAIKSTDLFNLASNGVELEDGWIKPDAIAQPDPKDKAVVGIEIHSGRNRIIHRMFEHLGYTVDKLDRVLYAGIEKGKLKRGEWRELTEKELKNLKRLVHMK